VPSKLALWTRFPAKKWENPRLKPGIGTRWADGVLIARLLGVAILLSTNIASGAERITDDATKLEILKAAFPNSGVALSKLIATIGRLM
jgi:hypothetical protein